MNRKERVAHLTDEIIAAVAITAGNEWSNGSGYIEAAAVKIGASDDEVREASDAAARAIDGFLRRRRKHRAALREKRR